MKRIFSILSLLPITLAVFADPITDPILKKDTLFTELKNDIVVVSTTKETNSLRSLPAAVTVLSPRRLESMQIKNLKDLSSYIPNYSVADYGSKMTAPIYIRGIGARSGTQTVSMYVDNIPYFNTTSFDMEMVDLQRVEVLRGTQSTLYGRNAMGGLLNIYTYSPLSHQGTNIKAGGGSYGEFSAQGSHSMKLGDNIGVSASAFYKRNDGYFRFDSPNSSGKVDNMENTGGRLKFAWNITPKLSATISTSFDYVDQGAFPYQNKATNKIAFSSDAYYKRKLSTNGLALRYSGNGFEINSTTGYQYLNDEMNMDQDYTDMDIFQINQRQNENSLSQEFTIKSVGSSNYQWSSGIFGFYDYLKTTAPVFMMKDGISQLLQPGLDKGMGMMTGMMEKMMREKMAESGLPPFMIDGIVTKAMAKMPNQAKISDDEIVLGGLYRNKVYGAAIFHQSTYSNLFTDGLSVTLGARLDYEKTTLNYESTANTNFRLSGSDAVVPVDLLNKTAFIGKTSDDFLEFLPKAVIKYAFDEKNYLYGSVSRGYKTGGHNIQMFADVLQGGMAKTMTGQIAQEVVKLAPSGVIPENVLTMIENMGKSDANVNDYISFKPEYSWSYEIGGKFDILSDILSANFSAYYMDVKDVQVTQFVVSGGGRMVSNAGKARSQGVELGVQVRPCKGFYLYANYGFSDAKFRSYIAGKDKDGSIKDYSRNYIPFAPRSTFSVGGTVSYNMKRCIFIDRIVFNANYAGTGKIYWDEANTKSQGFHGDMNARVAFHKNQFAVEAWGKNLLNKKYDTFSFESMGRNFAQVSKPIRFGGSFKVSF